jgi:hypothetical protein
MGCTGVHGRGGTTSTAGNKGGGVSLRGEEGGDVGIGDERSGWVGEGGNSIKSYDPLDHTGVPPQAWPARPYIDEYHGILG